MAVALFVLGHAGSGKTQLAKRFIKSRLHQKESWCMMDKDTAGECLAAALMKALGMNVNDRDSVEYKQNIRDLEYQACLDMAADQLKLGINVVLPGPWTKELNNGKVFCSHRLGFPEGTQLIHVYLNACQHKIQQRIIDRKNPRDEWKLNNWDKYSSSLKTPTVIHERNILTFNSEEDFGLQEKLILSQIK